MSIEFHCSQCGRLLRTPDEAVGRMAQCPECGAQTQVQAPEATAPSAIPPPGPGYQGAYQTPPGHVPAQGAQATQYYAIGRVTGPAVSLIVTAVVGLALHVVGILAVIFKVGMAGAMMHKNAMPEILVSGPTALAQTSIGLVLSIVVLIGAIKMKNLESYGFAMAASIVALFPCIGPCCLLGIPFGIWSLVVLSDPAVKSSFKY